MNGAKEKQKQEKRKHIKWHTFMLEPVVMQVDIDEKFYFYHPSLLFYFKCRLHEFLRGGKKNSKNFSLIKNQKEKVGRFGEILMVRLAMQIEGVVEGGRRVT